MRKRRQEKRADIGEDFFFAATVRECEFEGDFIFNSQRALENESSD